ARGPPSGLPPVVPVGATGVPPVEAGDPPGVGPDPDGVAEGGFGGVPPGSAGCCEPPPGGVPAFVPGPVPGAGWPPATVVGGPAVVAGALTRLGLKIAPHV